MGDAGQPKGFSSDQYLHPLFSFLGEQRPKGKLTLANGEELQLTSIESVNYTDPYFIALTFSDNKTVNLVIGVLPRNASEELTRLKVTSTEYFLSLTSDELSILFKDKKSNRIASITFDKAEKEVLNYCLKVQLRGLSIPELVEE